MLTSKYIERKVHPEDYKNLSPAQINYYVERYTSLYLKGQGRTPKQGVRIREIRQILIVNGKKFDDQGNIIGIPTPEPKVQQKGRSQNFQKSTGKNGIRPRTITTADTIVVVGNHINPELLPANTALAYFHKVTGHRMPKGWRFYDSLDLLLLLQEPDYSLTQILGQTISPFADENEYIIYHQGNFITLSETQIRRNYPDLL